MVASAEPQEPSPDHLVGRARLGRLSKIVLVLGLVLAGTGAAAAADLEDAERLFRTGHYDECVRLVADQFDEGVRDDGWALLRIRLDLTRGRYAAALAALEEAQLRFPLSAPLYLLGRDVYRYNGRPDDAEGMMDAIERLIAMAPRRFATPEGRVTIGRYLLLRGADARKVLDQFYDPARKQEPDFVDAYYATAELALEKQDYALAAETLGKAPKEAAEDPRFHYLQARAFSADDRSRADKEVAEALKINPHHVDSLLLRADHLIDGEEYAEAAKVLEQVYQVNPREPRAWAYRAVLAHLKNDHDGEKAARQSALETWSSNPEVDFLIGRKLAQKYRFAEGAAAQKQALTFDPEYLPAKIQLCEDLLRLGDESEGWKLAAQIFAKDGYNIVAYNLITLRDQLAGFRTLKGDGLIVRMDAREADLYGDRVLDLLGRARKTLGDRYGVTLSEPVIVEVFPRKKEFAVRTFGLPGADGLLGVCFGRVITANSPASQGAHPSNWESVLWHEFCHVITLSKTRNKMPRWLSEGISVYEEGREDPSWSSPLTPKLRTMILGDDLTPLSRLSSAFLAPKTPLHLQFAYFESALAVEFFVNRFGLPALKDLLDDLGAGITINESLPRRTKTTLVELDREFTRFAREKAQKVAPSATWEEPKLPADADSKAVAEWLEGNPKSFRGMQQLAVRLMAEQKWERARDVLESLKDLYPEYVGPENAYMLLAAVHKHRSAPAAEHKVLDDLAARSGDASEAYLRLMELDEAARDWRGLKKNAIRLLAVNPLIPAGHRQLARAAEELGDRDLAIKACRALVQLDDTDPAAVHYRLARLLREAGKPAEAKREVLRSLEEAPRFQEAHRLLLELVERDGKAGASVPPSPSVPPATQSAKP